MKKKQTNKLKVSAKALLFDPAVIYAGSNILINLQSDSKLAVAASAIAFALTTAECCRRANAKKGGQALWFKNQNIVGVKKAITSPSVYYGMSYAFLGIMTGGGMNLLSQPLQHPHALVSTGLGVGITTLSFVGSYLGKFKNPAAPLMVCTLGDAALVSAGIASGNGLGVACMGASIWANFRLAQMNYFEPKKNEENVQKSVSKKRSYLDSFFHTVSDVSLWPLRKVNQMSKKRALKECSR